MVTIIDALIVVMQAQLHIEGIMVKIDGLIRDRSDRRRLIIES
jgi:hypothetical protein